MTESVPMTQFPTSDRPVPPGPDPTPSVTLHELDETWYPILRRSFQLQGDAVDSALGVDQVDARGTFRIKDVELELKETVGRQHLENELGLSWGKVHEVLRKADLNGDGTATYKDFLQSLQEYRVHSEGGGALKKIVRAFAYVEEFHTWPPPVFMIAITLLELGFFVYHAIHIPEVHGVALTWEGPVPYCSVLIFNPFRRWEAWRFLTYMLVHIGIGHFVFNMIMQVIVGLPLEMQQEGWWGSLRVGLVYFCGVVAGSLGTTLVDPYTYIAGASGGVYALIAAHLATLILNWREDGSVKVRKVIHQPMTRIIRLVFIILLTAHDVALAVYVRFYSDGTNRTGFMGHLCGAIGGFLVGTFILDNRRVQKWEKGVQWTAFGLYLLLVAAAVLWNFIGNACTDGSFFPPSNLDVYDDESGNCPHY